MKTNLIPDATTAVSLENHQFKREQVLHATNAYMEHEGFERVGVEPVFSDYFCKIWIKGGASHGYKTSFTWRGQQVLVWWKAGDK